MRSILCVLLCALVVPVQAAITVSYSAEPSIPCSSGTIIAEAHDSTKRVTTEWTSALAAQSIALEQTARWRVRLEARNCWAPEIEVDTSVSSSYSAVVRAAGQVTGRLIAERGARIPQSARGTLNEHRLHCTVAGERLTCVAPTISGDVRIELPGFVPRYFSSISIAAGENISLGDIALKRGSSIAGNVAMSRGREPLTDAVVTLKPVTVVTTLAEKYRVAASTRTMKPTAKGFFQFTGVERGRYEVRASRTGWSSSRPVFVDVEPDRESQLAKPLLLEPLVALEIVFDPPVGPDGLPWIVKLQDDAGDISSPAGPDGRWSKTGIESGRRFLTVLDQARNAFHEEGIDVTPAMGPLFIRLDQVAVRGRVTLGEEPMIEARVKFSRQTGRRAFFETDDEGAFSGALPAEGSWDVDVVPKGKRSGVRAGSVEVRRADGAAAAQVEIALQGGRVAGRVVDDSGAATTGAVYVYRKQKLIASDATAEDGTFEFLGVPIGEIEIRAARGRRADSGIQTHRVKGAENDPLLLVLRKSRRVQGWIISQSGRPVAGATIRYFSDSTRSLRETVSGPDGEFEITVSSADTEFRTVIVAPAYAVKLIALTADDQPKEIVLDRGYGTLFIRTPTNLGVFVRRGAVTAALLSLVSTHSFGPPPDFSERGWAIPLEPGSYFVCPSYFAPADACKAVTLAQGGQQTVSVDFGGEHPRSR